MGYPKAKTVGEVIDYLQNLLDEGAVSRESGIMIEMYALTAEDTILKPHEEELGYHVPDDIMDEVFHFRLGWWSGSPDPSQDGAAYVAISCYLENYRLKEIAKEKVREEDCKRDKRS